MEKLNIYEVFYDFDFCKYMIIIRFLITFECHESKQNKKF